ncbi:MAG: nitrite/sulfite reductase [Candidatus Accumulibacter sp.]|jgi:sulfite reductase (NADPH) hemoprotein beta-component|nr:nitrite/sulfite reductase [Accumulibacter sp.]
MYRYDAVDHKLLKERVAQHRGQIERNLTGLLSDEELRPIRLQNGLYIERHAPMLRVAVPYGQLSSNQLRKLAEISRRYDRRSGHFTTRHNMQFNWPGFKETPDILEELSTVDMHAIQSSGSCIRNITTDPFAGVAPDEREDPRPYCEILRQWSTFHPEFTFLPRKFKIAVSGSADDRAVIRLHDLGLEAIKNDAGETGFRVFSGGGMGRAPMIGQVVREFLPRKHLLSYAEALLRVYNRHGRRDSLYKARIKILVAALGVGEFTRQVESEWAYLKDGPSTLTDAEFERISRHFAPPPYENLTDDVSLFTGETEEAFTSWIENNVFPHKVPGYAAVVVSLKAPGHPPGDITDVQMDALADIADRFGFGELRVGHEQNLVLSDVRRRDLPSLREALFPLGLATPTVGLLTDMICCPGGDYCNLANARSLPLAKAIQEKFDDPRRLCALGKISLNISGCMNSCAHHHVANIGILGVDKNDKEYYQVSLGGRQGNRAKIGRVIGPAFPPGEIPGVVESLIEVFIENRRPSETFIDAFERLGVEPFRARAYKGRDKSKLAQTDEMSHA